MLARGRGIRIDAIGNSHGSGYIGAMRRALLFAAVALIASWVAAEEYFVPMVAQKQGLDGAWWNTEVWVVNTTTSTGSFGVVFLPAKQDNADKMRVEPDFEDVAPGATAYSSELVPEGQLGVLRIVASQGLVAYARVFNSAGMGSFGQGMPAYSRSAATRPGEMAHLLGLRKTPQYRTNLGIFNIGTDAGVVRVRVYNQRGELTGEESYRLGPGAYVQMDDFLHAFGVQRGEHLRAEVSGSVPFLAFASVVDGRSGAPTSVFPTR
jgi:hypothetical protein